MKNNYQQQHAPEPWRYGCNGQTISADNGQVLPSTACFSRDQFRIITCVNACAGMADPAAEIGGLRALLLETQRAAARLTQERDEARAARDQAPAERDQSGVEKNENSTTNV